MALKSSHDHAYHCLSYIMSWLPPESHLYPTLYIKLSCSTCGKASKSFSLQGSAWASFLCRSYPTSTPWSEPAPCTLHTLTVMPHSFIIIYLCISPNKTASLEDMDGLFNIVPVLEWILKANMCCINSRWCGQGFFPILLLRNSHSSVKEAVRNTGNRQTWKREKTRIKTGKD